MTTNIDEKLGKVVGQAMNPMKNEDHSPGAIPFDHRTHLSRLANHTSNSGSCTFPSNTRNAFTDKVNLIRENYQDIQHLEQVRKVVQSCASACKILRSVKRLSYLIFSDTRY